VIAVATAAFLLQTFLMIAGGVVLPEGPGYLNLLAETEALLLLAPASALFFWSQRSIGVPGRGLAIVALAISVLSVILLYGLVFPYQYAPGEHAVMTVYEPINWLYVMVGMPVNGALFLASAFRYGPKPTGAAA
jgi:hypothetical protein